MKCFVTVTHCNTQFSESINASWKQTRAFREARDECIYTRRYTLNKTGLVVDLKCHLQRNKLTTLY